MNKTKTIWLALLTMLLWGSLFPTVKLGFSLYRVESTADILLFAGIRFVICGAAICLFQLLRERESYRPVRSSILPILLSGVFSIVLHYAFTYTGLELTDSSKTALIKQVGALFYVSFSFLFIKGDRPTVKKIAAALLGFSGIAVLNLSGGGFTFSVGDLFILAASFCTVFSSVISKRVFERVTPITATGVSQLFGGAVLLATGLLMGGRVTFAWDASLFLMVYVCIASIVSYCIWFSILRNGELSRLFIIKFSEPAFAAVFGALILGENILKLQYLIAFLLIVGGILLAHAKGKRARPENKKNDPRRDP